MPSTRDRIVATTAGLFRRQGFVGTGLKQIVAEADAPFGSVYHFFPGGKVQLGAEVIRSSGHEYQKLLEAIFDAAPDIVAGVARCFSGAAKLLHDSGYADACPIETVALEVASTNDTLRLACGEVFEAWFEEATRRLTEAGIGRARARELAIIFVCTLEGAFVLSRTLRSPEPIEAAGRFAAAAVAGSLPAKKPRLPAKRRKTVR
jgi:AcrR family transcriptional regulator